MIVDISPSYIFTSMDLAVGQDLKKIYSKEIVIVENASLCSGQEGCGNFSVVWEDA